MLALDSVDRQDSNYYFKWVSSEYDNLSNNMPIISNRIIKKYEKEFNTLCTSVTSVEESTDKPTVIEMNTLELTDHKRAKYELERYAMNCFNEIN